MAVTSFLFRAEFGERLLNLREIKQRVVSEAVRAAWSVENQSLGCPAKRSQSLPIARGGQHAHESARTFLGWNLPQLSEQARVVGFVVRILVGQVRLVRGVAR